MRHRMRDREGQRLLAVAHRLHADAERLAHRAGPSVCGHKEPGRNLRPVRQRHPCFRLTGQDRTRRDAGPEIDIRQLGDPGHDFAPQEPVGDVPAEGLLADLGRVEILDDPGLWHFAAGIDDAHDFQCCGMGREPVPESGFGQDRACRLKEGGRAQIGARAVIGHGWRRIDADNPKPRRAEGCRRGQPGHAAAGDQDVGRLCHGPAFRSGRP